MRPFIGIDIGGTKCAVTLSTVNRGIHIVEKRRFPSDAPSGPDAMLNRICAAIDDILTAQSLAPADIEAIGISCGGPLDSRKGIVLCPPNLPGWINIPVTEYFEKRYGIRSYLLNDANACALVEWKLGAGRGCRDMIFLTMGTGMGGGVIANGQLLIGASDMAGEIGHLRLSEDGPVGFGKAGSFEGYTSGGGIARQAQTRTEELLALGRAPAWITDGFKLEDVTAQLIARYAHEGDADARRIYIEIGYWLGMGLAQLIDAFNPEKIVIGSIFQRSHDLMEDAMRMALKEEAIPYSLDAVQILPAETGEELGDYAAVMTALYALGIDPMYENEETDERVLSHFERLFLRYPDLKGLKRPIMESYRTLRDCYAQGGKLLVCGNGGSCADSEHIVGELMKGFYLKRPTAKEGPLAHLQGGLPAIALTGHAALSSAFSNDVDPEYVYAQQTLGYGRKGDVLLGISTSGNSKNVVHAIETASQLGLYTIGLTGGRGGRLADLCDISISAPGSCPADVQEYHLPIYHTLCAMLEAHFYKE